MFQLVGLHKYAVFQIIDVSGRENGKGLANSSKLYLLIDEGHDGNLFLTFFDPHLPQLRIMNRRKLTSFMVTFIIILFDKLVREVLLFFDWLFIAILSMRSFILLLNASVE